LYIINLFFVIFRKNKKNLENSTYNKSWLQYIKM
jgi:hypothetical protein